MRISLGVLTAIILLPNAGNASPIIYSHPSVFPGPYLSFTSDRDAGGAGFRTWDSFVLPQTTIIDGVNWQGFYLNFLTPPNNPAAPDTTSWEISFWSNSGGQPGALLYSQTIPFANVPRTLVGFIGFNLPPTVTVALTNFEATLSSMFQAQAGTTYWLSILSNSTTFNPVFSWYQGTGGNGISVQTQLPGGGRSIVTGDRQFSLEGQSAVIPEPTTAILLLIGLAVPTIGLAWQRLRNSVRLVVSTIVVGTFVAAETRLYASVIVTPASAATVEGDFNNGTPFNTSQFNILSARYQQVYSSSLFPSFSFVITDIAFRPDGSFGRPFNTTFNDITIQMSTTPIAPTTLVEDLADNHGSDLTTVHQGQLLLFSSALGPTGGPSQFDVVIHLQTPFFYDPALGNLMLDITNPNGGFSTQLDAIRISSMGRVEQNNGVPSPTTGTVQRPLSGYVTQFTIEPQNTQPIITPEPPSLLAMLIALGVIFGFCLPRNVRARRAMLARANTV